MGGIDLTPKTDRELLLLVAEQGNETKGNVAEIKKQLTLLNGTVRHHDRVIARFEGLISGAINGDFLPRSRAKKIGVITGMFFVVSLIACATQAFGRAMGWW